MLLPENNKVERYILKNTLQVDVFKRVDNEIS